MTGFYMKCNTGLKWVKSRANLRLFDYLLPCQYLHSLKIYINLNAKTTKWKKVNQINQTLSNGDPRGVHRTCNRSTMDHFNENR